MYAIYAYIGVVLGVNVGIYIYMAYMAYIYIYICNSPIPTGFGLCKALQASCLNAFLS